MRLTEENLQAQIDALPREHPPKAYEVLLLDRKDKLVDIRYVRASSKERAELTAKRVQYFLFKKRKPVWPTARLYKPIQIDLEN